ncbi:hypothetical protein VE03_03958 [Pseudogymnoascus sp. 23342-1-I1]|nr:hypothetical protein VE03_03958 [Pseudogymnoascus sp. 23342-1-I1]
MTSVNMNMRQDADVVSRYGDLRNENAGAVIENPLAHLNQEQLLRDVDAFAASKSFSDDICLGLRRAALVAQNSLIYDEVSRGRHIGAQLPVQLTDAEKRALRDERDHLFAQSKGLYMTVLTVSIAAILQGWVQSSINGATLLWPKQFHLDKNGKNGSHGPWIIGLTNAAPFLFAAVLGCPLVDPINRRFGRRGAILVAAALIFVSSLGSAFVEDWRQLFACRVFNGIGMGLKASSTPILAAETAVSLWRGSSALCWQLWVAFGIALGFVANLIVNTAQEERLSMKLQLGAPIVPALVLMVSLWWCPESPRWHMMKGDIKNYRKAYDIFVALRNTPIQAQRDFYLIHKQIELETHSRQVYDAESILRSGKGVKAQYNISDYANRLAQLFSPKHPRLRNALLAACTVNLAQQLCGINVLAFYSSDVFSSAGNQPSGEVDNTKAYLYSFGFGAINFIFCIPAIRNIDTLGRRALLLGTLPFMSIFLFAAAFCFYIPADSPARMGPIALFLFLFAAVYSPGMGPMPFTVASESFPLSHRESGVAVSVGLNLFFAALLTLFYLPIHNGLGDTGSLCLFACLNLVAAALIFFFLPETKQRSLEELDLVFAVPIKKFMNHQLFKVVPYYINYYILRKNVTLDDLYQDKIWDHGSGIGLQSISITGEDKGWPPAWSTRTAGRDSIALAPDETNNGFDGTGQGTHSRSQGHDARSISSSVGTFD